MEDIILYDEDALWLICDNDRSARFPLADELTGSKLTDAIFGDTVLLREGTFRLSGGSVAIDMRVVKQSGLGLPDGIGLKRVGLRESWQLLPEEAYRKAAKGAELINWSRATRFCSVCGSRMERASEISKRCADPECGREVFPSLWPAIVVLVIKKSPDGDPAKEEALLVHARNLRRPEVQTLVAGFVETGESLEECVAREVREETSLDITDIRYVGSQSWPFPHQLMLGFTARYNGGEIRFADGELSFGGFFRRDSLPELPTMPSLSRRIIDNWKNNL